MQKSAPIGKDELIQSIPVEIKKKRGRPKKIVDDRELQKLKARKQVEVPMGDSPCNACCTDSSDMDFKADPGKIVHHGQIISAEVKPTPAAPVKGVRTYNHNRWTLTGLKRLESLVAGKEEKAHCNCKECDAVFKKSRSLQVRGI